MKSTYPGGIKSEQGNFFIFLKFMISLWLFLFLFVSQVEAINLTLSGNQNPSRTFTDGNVHNTIATYYCQEAIYRIPIIETYEGKQLELLVDVTEEDNQAVTATNSPCLVVQDGALTFALVDDTYENTNSGGGDTIQKFTPGPDNIGADGIQGNADDNDGSAHMDLTITVVEAGTNTPVVVDRIMVTGFDLDDSGGTPNIGTDDIYFLADAKTRAYLSDDTKTTLAGGSFFTVGFNAKVKGFVGNCQDTVATPDPSCRASGIFTDTSSFKVRLQNDKNSVRRIFNLSFKGSDFEALMSSEYDYGDTPNTYPDASQVPSSHLSLGTGFVPDGESSQSHSADAIGDDTDNALDPFTNFDDEDGVFLADGNTSLNNQIFTAGSTESLTIKTIGSGYLNAWIDWNVDGDFDDAGEQVITQSVVNTGEYNADGTVNTNASDARTTTLIPLNIPVGIPSGRTFARFKFTENKAPFSGIDSGKGEVEDYAIIIQLEINATDDNYTVVGSTGGVVGDITSNDTLGGVTVIDTDINITLTGDTNLSVTPSVDSSGNLSVPPNTPPGTYYVTYKICEIANPTNCDEANATIIVTSILTTSDDNATNPSPALPSNPTSVDILTNDTSDATIDPSSVTITTTGATDTDGDGDADKLVVSGEGVWDINNTTGNAIFTPEAGFTGDPTPIEYTVKNNFGLLSDKATITIDYPQNPPITKDDNGSNIPLNTAYTLDPFADNGYGIDTDPEDDINKSSLILTSSSVVGAIIGSDGKSITVPNEGIWKVESNGSVSFTPNPDFTGDPTPVGYKVFDNTGLLSNESTITLDYVQLRRISGNVSVDTNDSNRSFQNVGDRPPLASIKMELLSLPFFVPLQTTYTDANGDYSFENVPQGNYYIRETQPTDLADVIYGPYTNVLRTVILSSTDLTDIDFIEKPKTAELTLKTFFDLEGNVLFTPGVDNPMQYINITVTDVYGTEYNVTTGADGNITLPNIPIGSVSIKVDSADPDIEDGYDDTGNNADVTIILTESGYQHDIGFYKPPNNGIEPADLATCSDPTSITWEGATVSTATAWDDTTQPLTVVSGGGAHEIGADGNITSTVIPGKAITATFRIDDNSSQFNHADGGTGTDTAFDGPFFTMYLGDQNTSGTPGDSSTYGLKKDEFATLTVDFNQSVILDNWKMRDVDAGALATINATLENNWDWQDAVNMVGYDRDGNEVPLTRGLSDNTKLIQDAEGFVYNSSDQNGSGFAPSDVDAFVIWSSNGVPLNKIVITHRAGPDKNDQTRAAIALSGFAVCVPLEISGTVFDDADGNKNGQADGNATGVLDNNTTLYAHLVNGAGIVVDVVKVDPVTGTYFFDKNIDKNVSYAVQISTVETNTSAVMPTSVLPTDWNFVSENNDTDDANMDGIIPIGIITESAKNMNLGVDKAPVSAPIQGTPAANPGGTVDVPLDDAAFTEARLNTLGVSDKEEGVPTTLVIDVLPADGTLYYDGNPVTAGQVIPNVDYNKITMDPNDGNTTVSFVYHYVDSAGVASKPSTISKSFFVNLPTAEDDNVTNTNPIDPGNPTTINVLGTDTNGTYDFNLSSVFILDPNGNKVKELNVTGEGVWKVESNGTITFTPEVGFYGDPTPIAYTVEDLEGNEVSANISIDYPQTPPTPNDDIFVSTVPANPLTPTVVDILSNDDDNESDIDISTVNISTAGAIDSDGDGDFDRLIVLGEGVWTVDNNTGEIIFTPVDGFTGDPTPITYNVKDLTGLPSTKDATVTIKYPRGDIIGHIYEDTNGNGIQDAGEPNLEDVEVIVTDALGNSIKVLTDVNGDYNVSGVAKGDVNISINEQIVTLSTGETLDEATIGEGDNPLTSLTVDGNTTTNAGNIGYIPSGTIVGSIYEDTNGNGIQDPGELGLAEVNLTITDVNGVEYNITTDKNGNYAQKVPAGDANISIDEATLPSNFTQTQGTNVTTVSVNAGGITTDIDGYEPPVNSGQVKGVIYEDLNGDGVQDPDEKGIEGVTVTITDSNGNARNYVTDANGSYVATVPSGSTTVTIDPITVSGGSVYTGTTGETTVLNVPANGIVTDEDGYQPAADVGTITSIFYLDKDGDGIQDPDEFGIGGVTVTITDEFGNTQTVVTDENGSYSVSVPPNTITGVTLLSVDENTLPSGLIQTQGSKETIIIAETGKTVNINYGYQPSAQMGELQGKVYEDTNGNGIQDPGEPGIEGVDVTVTDVEGNIITLVTDENGSYSTFVLEGEVVVDIEQGDIPSTSTRTEGTDPTIVTIVAGAIATDIDGFEPLNPSISLIKSASYAYPTVLGSVVTYDFDVSNTGNAKLTDINITDTLTGLSAIICPNTELDANMSMVCQATYAVTQADVAAGGVENTATVSGTPNTTDGKILPPVTDISDTGTDENGTIIANPEDVNSSDANGTNDGDPKNDPTIIRFITTVPTAVDDNATGVSGQPTIVDVVGNDTDPENDINISTVDFNVSSVPNAEGNDTDGDGDIDKVTVPGEGVWTVDENGTVTFTPEPNFTGDPSPIGYTVTDKTGLTSNEAKVTIDYPQTPPVTDRDYKVEANQTKSVTMDLLVNDKDNENDINTSSIDLNASTIATATVEDTDGDGDIDKVTVPGEGVWTVDENGTLTFTPDPTLIGDPTPITYTVKDKTDLLSNPSEVYVDYPPYVPQAEDDNQTGTPQTPVTIDVLANDSDKDGDLNKSTVKIIDPNGNETTQLVVPNEGNWTVESDGSITFTPDPNFTGDPTPITYTVKDKGGQESPPATVRVDYPQELSDDNVVGTFGQPTTVNVLDNDDEVNASTVQLIDPDTNLTMTTLTVPNEGKWTVESNGSITFTPDPNFTGDPTPVKYTAKDTNGNPVPPAVVTVAYPNAPQDDNVTGVANTPTTVNVLQNDGNDTDPTSIKIIDPDTNNTVTTLVVPNEGNWTVENNGSITFTPNPNFTGDPTPIKYIADDTNGNPLPPASINIDYPQTPPVTNKDYKVEENQSKPVTLNVLGNDNDAENDINTSSVKIIDPDTNNTVTELIVLNEGKWTVESNGSITFTPDPTLIGDPTPILYIVTDKTGLESNPSEVYVDYPPYIPQTQDDNKTGTPQTPVIIDVVGNDSDKDGDLNKSTVKIIDPNGNQVTELIVANEGKWTVDPNTGEITFTPDPNFTGDPTPITYTVEDSLGQESPPATVTVDYPQELNDDNVTGILGQPIPVDVLANDDEVNASTVKIIDPDTNLTVTTLTVPNEGEWTVDENGTITFTPNPNFTGDPTPIKYTAEDTNGNPLTPAVVTVTYPQSPLSEDDNEVGVPSNPVTIDILGNDDTVDPTTVKIIDPITDNEVKTLIVPNEGTWTVNPNGTITFTPEDGFRGDPTPIHYTVEDENGNKTNVAKVTVDYPPVVEDDIKVGVAGQPVTVSILSNDTQTSQSFKLDSIQITDKDGNVIGDLEGKELIAPGEGVWIVNDDGTITFTPEDGFIGSPTPIYYTVEDENADRTNAAQVTVTYPEANDDEKTISHFGPTKIDVLINDTNEEGETCAGTGVTDIIITQEPKNGNAYASEDKQSVLYEPFLDYPKGTDEFEYQIIGGACNGSKAKVRLNIDCASSQTSDKGSALGSITLLILMSITMMIGFYYIRREENRRGER